MIVQQSERLEDKPEHGTGVALRQRRRKAVIEQLRPGLQIRDVA